MRQVPPQYLIIGNGRVARHFQHYFSLLGLFFTTWHRPQSLTALHDQLSRTTHVLILISDRAIEEFVTVHLKNTPAKLIHFSGSLITEKAYGAHPLMTFNSELYSLEQYQAIPFVLDHDAPSFEELLPGLPNSHARLAKSLKPKYHALCVLSNNFSCLLWQKLLDSLEKEFQLPSEIAHMCLQQQTKNLISNRETAFTGPLARGDQLTIQKNIAALSGDPFQKIYESFVTCYEYLKEKP